MQSQGCKNNGPRQELLLHPVSLKIQGPMDLFWVAWINKAIYHGMW
jgi:hypothetical protein